MLIHGTFDIKALSSYKWKELLRNVNCKSLRTVINVNVLFMTQKLNQFFIFCSQGNDQRTCVNKLDSMSESIISIDEELSESAVIDVPLEISEPEVVGGAVEKVETRVDGVVKESKVADGTVDTGEGNVDRAVNESTGIDGAAEVMEDVDGAADNDRAGSSSNEGRINGSITSSLCISADEAKSVATVKCRKEYDEYNSDVVLLFPIA